MAAGAEQPVGCDLPDRGKNEQTHASSELWIPTAPQGWEGSRSCHVSSYQTPTDAVVINVVDEVSSFSAGVVKVVKAILHSVHEPVLAASVVDGSDDRCWGSSGALFPEYLKSSV